MRSLSLAVMAAALALSSTPSLAETPADAIKYRKQVMAAMGAHIGAFTLVNFGRVPHQDHLKAHASALADLGAQTRAIFPEGSGAGDTDALPLIWQEQERFGQAGAALEKATADLKAAVDAGDKAGTARAFKALGDSCKGCHDRYRKAQK
jgi:cytochrome c556